MTERLPFIDWMKALGMLVIIYGHASAGGLLKLTEPFNAKQLGVAFFIFVLGFSLARETRPPARVLFNRLFEIFLFGIAAALVMSFVGLLTSGNLAESNYLPFVFGANVFVDFFPANSTTWYIGMYLHMLVFWALLVRRWRVEPWMLVLSFTLEVLIRALILSAGANFVAYMLISNWCTVFLLGVWYGQRDGSGRAPRRDLPLYLGGLVALLLLWPRFYPMLDIKTAFPFSFIRAGSESASWFLTSASISTLYLLHTWLVFQISSRLGDVRAVRFFARNTLLVFIIHWPLVRLLSPWIHELVSPVWLRLVINFLVYFVGLSLFSEVVQRFLQARRLRDAVASRI